jgi:hypothetical protein
MKRLRSCEGCARHVFETERVCPFCLTELAAVVPRELPAVPIGASRAQRLALAAALGGQGLVGCAQEQAALPMAIYGAPVAGNVAPPSVPTPAGQSGGATRPPAAGRGGGAVPDAGGVAVPVYGAPLAGQAAPIPPPPDAAAAFDEDAGVDEPPDASLPRDGGPMVHPVYGAPIPEYGAPPPPRSKD